MKNLTKVLFTFLLSLSGFSQNIVPELEWREVDFPGHFPEGNIFDPNSGHQTQKESASDWWYDIVPMVDEQGRKNGFITAGFATWLDLTIDETSAGGCYTTFAQGSPNCNRPLTDNQKISAKLNMIGKYDLAGNMLWCKSYSNADEGAVAVNSTSDGGYIFVGWGEVTRNKSGDVIPLNPTTGNNGFDLADLALCDENEVKTLVGKVNSDGDLLWLNQYSYYDVTGNQPIDKVNDTLVNLGFDLIEMDNAQLKVLSISEDKNNPGDNKFFFFILV